MKKHYYSPKNIAKRLVLTYITLLVILMTIGALIPGNAILSHSDASVPSASDREIPVFKLGETVSFDWERSSKIGSIDAVAVRTIQPTDGRVITRDNSEDYSFPFLLEPTDKISFSLQPRDGRDFGRQPQEEGCYFFFTRVDFKLFTFLNKSIDYSSNEYCLEGELSE